MAAAVIRVRRRDFASGSHKVAGLQGIAESVPRGVTIYLLPGLTGRQRRAVIRRLRQEASRGCGPRLPLAQLLFALLLDQVRGALGLAAGAVRLHPGTTMLPAVFIAAVMTLFVLVSAGAGPGPAGGPALAAAQSGTGLGSTVQAGAGGPVGAGPVSAGGDREGAPAGAMEASDIRPSDIRSGGTGLSGTGSGGTGPGGRGLGSGLPAPAAGPRSAGRPRAARVCFGAMAGVAAKRSALACHRTSS
ncbi:MAG TPA: hypothetical protein VIL16_29695 [Trebonia sp.]